MEPSKWKVLEHSPYQKDRQHSAIVNQPYHQAAANHYGSKFSKSSTRKSSNNLNLQQMSFQGGGGSAAQNSKRVRESHSQSQSPSMLGVGQHNTNVA